MRLSVLRLDAAHYGYDTRIPVDVDLARRRSIERYDKNVLRSIETWLRDNAQILRLRWRTPAFAAREYRREMGKIAAKIDAMNQERHHMFYPRPPSHPPAERPRDAQHML